MKTDGRVGKSKLQSPRWASPHSPGDYVAVKHYGGVVLCRLAKQRIQPTGTWWARKLLYGKWTADVVVVERHFKKIPGIA
jgi:hypothetical protein